jgi:hypothetical protein
MVVRSNETNYFTVSEVSNTNKWFWFGVYLKKSIESGKDGHIVQGLSRTLIERKVGNFSHNASIQRIINTYLFLH